MGGGGGTTKNAGEEIMSAQTKPRVCKEVAWLRLPNQVVAMEHLRLGVIRRTLQLCAVE